MCSIVIHAVDISDYKSRNVNVDSLINMRSASSFHSRNSISISGDGIKTPYDIALKLRNSTLLILTAVYNSDFGLNLNVGVRDNMHSVYGDHFVYNVNPSFSF
jgi:vitamin B12 transporter